LYIHKADLILPNLQQNKEYIEILIKWLNDNPVAPVYQTSKTTTLNKNKPSSIPNNTTQTTIDNCNYIFLIKFS